MKKTLLVCDTHPLPADHGSSIRTLNFVRYFGTVGTLDIAYDYISTESNGGNALFQHQYVTEKKMYPKKFIQRLMMFFKGIPYPVREYYPHSKKLLMSIIEQHDYDYIIVRYIRNANFLFSLPEKYRKRIIVDFDDVLSGESLYHMFFYESCSPYKRFIRNLNKHLLVQYEKKCLRSAMSLFCSEKDRNSFEKNNKNSFVVPNVYENDTFANFDFGDGCQHGNVLLFVGSLFYSPNAEGLTWFIENIFPVFRQAHADARLLVVGRSPGEEIKDFCSRTEGVSLHPDVADIKEYYQKARAVVVPLLSGGGTRIKILEAALAGRPVLSTPAGAEGLDLVDGKHLLLFHNAEEFSLRYKEILDREKYCSMVSSAQEFVLKYYAINNFGKAMEKVLYAIDKR